MVVSPQAEEIIDYWAWGNGALGSKAMKCADHYSYSSHTHTHAHTDIHTHPKSRRMSHTWKLRSQLNTLANFLLLVRVWLKRKENSFCHGNRVRATIRLQLVPVCRSRRKAKS